MNELYVAVTGATVVANGAVAAGGLARAPFVVENAVEVGVAPGWVPLLSGLKAAGAIGLLAGIFGVPVVGTAAAGGLVCFFAGAIFFHIKTRVFHNIAFPGFFLALATASLALSFRH